MTMFTELYALATSATLAMVVSADENTGRLTISVLPKPKKDLGEPALTKDLTLTATPQEFDLGFIDALRDYREQRESLAKQASATKVALEAAKSLSAKKAAAAMAKVPKPAQTTTPASGTASEDGTDEIPADARTEETVAMTTARGETLQLFG